MYGISVDTYLHARHVPCLPKFVRFQRPTHPSHEIHENTHENTKRGTGAEERRLFFYLGVREGDSGAEPDAVEISYFRDPYTIQGSSSAAEYSWITGSIFWMKIDFVYGISVYIRGKTNRESARIPPFGLPESDLLLLTFASLLCSLAHPFIGSVRANPVGAPAPPIKKCSLPYPNK